MDRMLYVAMGGAKQSMLAQSVNANNLANVSTTGFRADLVSARSAEVQGPGYDSRVYNMVEPEGTDHSNGAKRTTGRSLDVAVKDNGYLAVQAPDGSEAYTRAGDLRVTNAGLLVNGSGHPVMGNQGPIAVPPHEKLDIGSDGTISIRPMGQDPRTLAEVDRIKLVDPPPAELRKGTEGLLRTIDGGPVPASAQVELSTGTLESSNVNAVEAMVTMIELGREFETQIKMMQTAKETDEASARLMQVR